MSKAAKKIVCLNYFPSLDYFTTLFDWVRNPFIDNNAQLTTVEETTVISGMTVKGTVVEGRGELLCVGIGR